MIETFARPRQTSYQVQAAAVATTREDADRIAVNRLRNAFADFEAACRKATDHYRRGRWHAGDAVLMRAAYAVAAAAGEEHDFDLIGVKVP